MDAAEVGAEVLKATCTGRAPSPVASAHQRQGQDLGAELRQDDALGNALFLTVGSSTGENIGIARQARAAMPPVKPRAGPRLHLGLSLPAPADRGGDQRLPTCSGCALSRIKGARILRGYAFDVFGAVLWCCHNRALWSSGFGDGLLWYCAQSHGGSLLKVLEPIMVLAASAFFPRPPSRRRQRTAGSGLRARHFKS